MPTLVFSQAGEFGFERRVFLMEDDLRTSMALEEKCFQRAFCP